MSELHHAACNGDPDWVRTCLQAGFDPNDYDESGYCPLHWVAFKGQVAWSPVETARLLLDAGADINARTRCEANNTALVLACQAGAGPLVRLLVESGADINVRCGDTTPLIAASISGCDYAAGLLLILGADATIKGPFRMTALEWAESNGFDHVIEVFRSHVT